MEWHRRDSSLRQALKASTAETTDAKRAGATVAVIRTEASFAIQYDTAAAIHMLKGEPSAGNTLPLTDAERGLVLRSLRGLKDAEGKFCGGVDDPGGWE